MTAAPDGPEPAESLSLIWMPTMKCNLCCAYCAARAFPNVTHGGHLPPKEWRRLFSECPTPIRQVAITGGEPSVYGGLGEVIDAFDWPFCVDTNLRIHPEKWLHPDAYERVVAINAGLQFHPDHPEVNGSGLQGYWEHIAWLREKLPQAQIVVVQVYLWRDMPEQWERGIARAADLGVEHRPTTFDDRFLFKEVVPVKPGMAEACWGGYDFAMIMPDSAVYRCIGHAYHAVDCLGKLTENGWGIMLEAPHDCTTLLCTVCDMCKGKEVLPVSTMTKQEV